MSVSPRRRRAFGRAMAGDDLKQYEHKGLVALALFTAVTVAAVLLAIAVDAMT